MLNLDATEKLTKLAETPFDLSKGKFGGKRLEKYCAEAAGLKLLYATERVDDDVMDALGELAAECGLIEKMHAMQSGEVINKIEGYESEERSVLHTAMRDFFAESRTEAAATAATELAARELEKLKELLSEIGDEFTDVVQVGIGGSDLGPRAIYHALEAYRKKKRRVHFISNVDPDDAALVLQGLDPEKTLVVVVSKSGTTLETLTNEELVKKWLAQSVDPKKHLVAITGKGSPMDDPSKYLASFYIWDYVGGRYSATSMVGAFILAFALGSDRFLEFLRGAHEMDRNALEEDPMKNLPMLMALLGVWNRNFLSLPTVAVIPYAQPLNRFAAHLQQVDMESNGKRINRKGEELTYNTGPVVWGEPGTNGQHSFFQSLHQGTSIVPIEFIAFKETQYEKDILVKGTTSQEKLLSNLIAQSIAFAVGEKNKKNPNKHFPGNRPNRIIFAEKLTPYTMGSLLSLYENKVAFQGFIWDVNSFDQEGVQLGKVLANKMIDLFANAREKGSMDGGDFPLGHALYKQLISE